MPQIVTVINVNDLEFGTLVELLHDSYCKDLPEIGGNSPVDLQEIEKLMVFFSNQYAYMVELWGTMLYNVRVLNRAGMKATQEMDEAMAKRDFLEKVMSATKLKADKCVALMRGIRDGKDS